MVEGTRYKVTLNFSGIETLEDYAVYGACQGFKCCSPAIPLSIGESIGSSVPVFIEPMKNGSYRYQIFIKRVSTNLEFLILQGRIEVSNRIGSENGSNCPQNAIVDTVLNADNVTVNVTVQEGSKGEDGKDGEPGIQGERGQPGLQGDKGEPGEKGEPFRYEDFTPEQLLALKGDKGDQGQNGEDAQPFNYSLIYNFEYKGSPQGTAQDNFNSYGFSYKVSQGGIIGGLKMFCRSGGGLTTDNEPIYIKIWNADNTLLATSDNSCVHALGTELSYTFRPFEVSQNQLLKVSFHSKNTKNNQNYSMDIFGCVRCVSLVEGEQGCMLNSSGTPSNTALTAVHSWAYLTPKFTQNNGDSGSIEWIQNNGSSITIGENVTASNTKSITIGNWGSNGDVVSGVLLNTVVIGYGATNYGSFSVAVGANSNVEDMYGVSVGQGARANGGEDTALGFNAQSNWAGVAVGANSWSSYSAVAIGKGAVANDRGIAIGYSAWSDYDEITLKTETTEVKFYPDKITLNGVEYGGSSGGGSSGGGSSGGGSEYDSRVAILKSELYDTKYLDIGMYEFRISCSNWWVDKDGYSGNWYQYYDDLTDNCEWLYSFNCSDCDQIFYECSWIKKFAAKLENNSMLTNSFYNCFELQSFYTPSQLRDCNNTFNGCVKLADFDADLSELNNAQGMFGYDSNYCTKLNLKSIKNIAKSISNNWGNQIYIGIDYSLIQDNGDGQYYECQQALNAIRNKGWTVYEIYSYN